MLLDGTRSGDAVSEVFEYMLSWYDNYLYHRMILPGVVCSEEYTFEHRQIRNSCGKRLGDAQPFVVSLPLGTHDQHQPRKCKCGKTGPAVRSVIWESQPALLELYVAP